MKKLNNLELFKQIILNNLNHLLIEVQLKQDFIMKKKH